MADLPGTNIQLVTVTGTYIDHEGESLDGWVRFTPDRVVADSSSAKLLMPNPIRLSLVDGSFEVQLLATDDPDGNPVGWLYIVEQEIDNVVYDAIRVELPGAGISYDMADLTPVEGGDGPIYIPPGGTHNHLAEHFTKVESDDRFVNVDGDAMADFLVLHADPTSNLQAATKQYADSKLALTGGTLSGPLVLDDDPAQPLEAATKQYVDAQLSIADLNHNNLTWGNGSGGGVVLNTIGSPTVVSTCAVDIFIPESYQAQFLNCVAGQIEAISDTTYDFYLWNQYRFKPIGGSFGGWATVQGSYAWGAGTRFDVPYRMRLNVANAASPLTGYGQTWHSAGNYEFRTLGGGDIAGSLSALIRGTAWVTALRRV